MNNDGSISVRLSTVGAKIAAVAAALLLLAFAVAAVRWTFARTVALRSPEIELVEAASAWAPSDPNVHLALAQRLDRTFLPEDSARSLAEFETAAALSPHDHLTWLYLGRAYERNGNTEAAERALRTSAVLAPQYAYVRWALGNTLLRKGRVDEAFAEIRAAAAADNALVPAAVVAALNAANGDVAAAQPMIGSEPVMNAEFAVQLAVQKRFADAEAVWQHVSRNGFDERLNSAADALARHLIDAKQYRFAQQVMFPGRPAGIDNGGFEEPLRPSPSVFEWNIAGGTVPRIGQTEGNKYSGNYSLLISFGDGTKEMRAVSQTIVVPLHRELELEMHVRSDLTEARGGLRLIVEDAVSGTKLAESALLAGRSDWSPVSVKFSSNAADAVVIKLTAADCPPTGCFLKGNMGFDEVKLR